MKDNTIKAGNGVDVYKTTVDYLADEYINSVLLESKDIYKKQCFAGMIKYISKRINVNTDDLVELNNYWDIYTELCSKYNHVISIERYCMLIGIHRDTFYSWKNEETKRDYSEILGSSRSDMIKKWDAESESSWQDEASTGNPGPMFVLKARRGWQETAPAQVPQNNTGITKTPEQIAAEMGVKYLPDRQAVEPPDMDF